MDRSEENPAAIWLCRGTGLLIILVVAALFPWIQRPPVDLKELVMSWGTVVLFTALLFVPGRRATRGPILATLGLYLVWMIIASAVSDHFGHSMYALHLLISSVAIAWAVSQFVSTVDHVRLLIMAMVFATAMGSVYGFFQSIGLDPMPWGLDTFDNEAYTGLPGPFGNANLAAHALAVGIVGAIYLAWGKQYWIYLPILIGFTWHLYRTGQRGALVALAAAAAVFLIIVVIRRSSAGVDRKIAMTFASAIIIGVIGLACLTGVHTALRGYPLPIDSSMLLRYNAFFGASEMIVDAPIFGHGYGNYVIENPPYWTEYEQRWFATRLKSNGHVHNELLESGVEGGLPGAALHLALFVFAIAQGLRWAYGEDIQRRRLGAAIACWFTVFFMDGLFGFNLRVPATGLFFFVMIGAVAGLARAELPVPAKPMRFRRSLEGAAMALCVMAAILSTVDFYISNRLKVAIDARNQGAYAVAMPAFQQIAPINYAGWEFTWEYARTLDALGRYEEALVAFEDALARVPHFPYALAGASQAALHLATTPAPIDGAVRGNALVLAAEYADRALELCPPLSPALEMRGRVQLIHARQTTRTPGSAPQQVEAYRNAVQDFQDALLYGGIRRGQLYLAKANGLRMIGERDEAARMLRLAAEADPQDADIWATYYSDALDQKYFSAFRKTFIALVEPIDDRKLYIEALYRYWNGDVPLEELVPRAVELAEQNKPVLTDVAGLRGHAFAIEILAQAVRAEIEDKALRARLFATLGAYYLLLNSPENTVPLFEAAHPHLEGNDLINVTVYLTQYYWDTGDNERAQIVLDDGRRRMPESPQLLLMDARAHVRMGENDAALQMYLDLIRNFPGLDPGLREIAEIEFVALKEKVDAAQ